MVAAAEALLPKLRTTMDAHAFHEGLEAILTVIRAANVYVDRQAPWPLRKTDEARMRTVLYTLAETIRNLALLTQPFMPTASGAILDRLAVAEASRTFATDGQGGRLGPGTALPKHAAVFPRQLDEDDLSA